MKASSGNLKLGIYFSIFLMTQAGRRTFRIPTYSHQFVKQNVEIPKRYPDYCFIFNLNYISNKSELLTLIT
jgi:hypothetical protein